MSLETTSIPHPSKDMSTHSRVPATPKSTVSGTTSIASLKKKVNIPAQQAMVDNEGETKLMSAAGEHIGMVPQTDQGSGMEVNVNWVITRKTMESFQFEKKEPYSYVAGESTYVITDINVSNKEFTGFTGDRITTPSKISFYRYIDNGAESANGAKKTAEYLCSIESDLYAHIVNEVGHDMKSHVVKDKYTWFVVVDKECTTNPSFYAKTKDMNETVRVPGSIFFTSTETAVTKGLVCLRFAIISGGRQGTILKPYFQNFNPVEPRPEPPPEMPKYRGRMEKLESRGVLYEAKDEMSSVIKNMSAAVLNTE